MSCNKIRILNAKTLYQSITFFSFFSNLIKKI